MLITHSWFVRTLAVLLIAFVAFFSVVALVRAEGDEPPVTPAATTTPDGATGGDGTPAESGDDGENNPPEPPVEPEPAIVVTGDAEAGTQTGSNANMNDITSLSGDLTATSTNEADVANSATTTAETGDNTAASPGGAAVVTGDALAIANVINVVNTNIINSTGLIAFLNYLFGDGFDLRALGLDYFTNATNANTDCSLVDCSDAETLLNVTNDATLVNDVIVRADTGGNTADGGDSIAIIETGDAYAAANVMNFVNTTLLNSNYLLVVGNNFGSLAGDITLPGVDFFRNLFANSGGGVSGPLDVTLANDGTVNDTTSANAGTGGNTADGGGSVIVTGNATAGGATVNQVNTTEVGGTSFMFLINVVGGEWLGDVFNTPEGISWTRRPDGKGLILMSDTGDLSQLSPGCCSGQTTVNATNTANVANNVSVYALTGDNYAGGAGGSYVKTGDAYAAANSLNLVNTTILGRNWIFAIFNIFGDWTGNVSFGKPDLWVGGLAEAGSPTRPNSEVKYCFTVSNTGDADAHNVILAPEFSPVMLEFMDSLTTFGERRGWPIGDIPRGDTREHCFRATTGDVGAGRSVAVPLTVTAFAQETEEDMGDNSDIVTIVIDGFLSERFTGAGRAASTGQPMLVMKKTASIATTTLGSSVDYTVVIRNEGAEVYKAKLTDTLKDPTGNVVYSRGWDLKTIYPDEEITLTYTIEFNKNLPLGLYTNTARITGRKGNVVDVYATDLKPVSVSSVIELRAGEPKVLGVQSEPLELQCAEYITDFIRPGAKNDKNQVKRLQYFFRDYEKVKGLATDGVLGPATIAAINNFQAKYESDVLGPWGMKKPSGYVYYTTRKKINEIYCQGISEFPLNEEQKSEINAFKNGLFGGLFGSETSPAPDAQPAYVKPSVLEAPAPVEAGTRVEAGARSFFDRLFEFGKSAFLIPEVNAQVLVR